MDNFYNTNSNQYGGQSNQYGNQPYQQNPQQYGNQPYQQNQYNQQLNPQQQYQQNQYGQLGPQYSYGEQSPYMNPQPQQYPPYDQPVKKNNGRSMKGFIIGLIAGVLVIALGVGAYIFLSTKADKEKAAAVAENFCNAFGSLDADGVEDCIYDKLFDDEEIALIKDEDNYAGLEFFDYSVENVEVTEVIKYDKKKAAKDIDSAIDEDVDVKRAFWVTVNFTESYEKDGETVENDESDNILCGKVDGQWYVIDPGLIFEKNDLMAEFEDEASEEFAKEVIIKYVNAFGDADAESMKECLPDKVLKKDDTEDEIDEIMETLEEVKEWGFVIEVNDIEITDVSSYDPDKAMENLSDDGIDLKVESAYKIKFKFTMSMSFLGEEEEEDESDEFICGKVDGKWYIIGTESGDSLFDSLEDDEEDLIDYEEDFEDEDDEDDDSASNSDDDDYESIEDVLYYDIAESYMVSNPEGLPEDLSELTFMFDGTVYTLPFDLSSFDSDWELDTEFFDEESWELDPGEYANSAIYRNSEYDDTFSIYLASTNYTDETIPYEESTVDYVSCDVEYVDCEVDECAELILPGGITWGSSLQDVYDTYGEADDIWVMSDSVNNRPYKVFLTYYIEEDNWSSFQLTIDLLHGVNDVTVCYHE